MAEQVSWDIGIDLGTTSVTVAYRASGSEETHLLQFGSPSATKDSNELPATFARSQDGWHFGPDVAVYSDIILFTDVKLGISGRSPYTQQLWQAVHKARQRFDVRETPVSLLVNLFRYILDCLKEQILANPSYRVLLDGRSFESTEKRCWVTYPVRQNDSLHLTLVEAAHAAGFTKVHGVSESIAAAYFAVLKKKVELREPSSVLIADIGGGSTVS
jgi:molecular chaperone DnaK (HSP70)